MLASMNVLFVGLAVVFLTLLLITGLVFLIPVLALKARRREHITNVSVRMKAKPVPAPACEPAPGGIRKPDSVTRAADKTEQAPDRGQTMAVIMAAIQAYMSAEPGLEGRTFRILSVRKAGGTAPIWNLAGRIFQTAGRVQGL